tara:strand:- start:4650 stop:5354 length:705 start_codon:yes stop_codon:yes gene_type:complete
MKTNLNNKDKLVNTVFSTVYKKYDLMNDVMSLGVHRVWKKKMIDWMKPQINSSVIDVASGTGDMAKLISDKNMSKSKICCVEPNKNMLKIGKNRLKKYTNIEWKLAPAENLPVKDNSYDFYVISFGIRNVSNINLCLKESLRVLKPGGRFMCLEFSKVENEILSGIYKNYSKIIPLIGKYIMGDSMPYKYLIESIDQFYNQNELLKIINNVGFSNVEYRNLSGGISAIHSGWKI